MPTRLHPTILSAASLIVCAALLSSTAGRARATGGGVLADLGDYERQAVEKVLIERGLSIEPNPEGKSVREIFVATLPVFSERDGDFLQWFNNLHVTTQPEVIEREVLLDAGEAWKPEKARETERNLRNPTFTTLAVVVPVKSPVPGTVDVLVVTRDIWSLRASTDFEFQNGVLAELFLSATEQNLMGRHKAVGAAFDMGLGKFSLGPQYFDPNVFGTHALFDSRVRVDFERGTGRFEGTSSETLLAYPLWNLDRTWGGDLSVTHADQVVREFRGPRLLRYDNPRTTEVESVPYRFELTDVEVQARGLYAVGEAIEHRFWAGYRLQLQQPGFSPDFPEGDRIRRAFRRDVLPPEERNSGPIVGWEFFVPKWKTYRDIATYDLPEEKNLGPFASLQFAPVLDEFGSLDDFLELSATVGGLADIGGRGFVRAEGSATTRFANRDWFDNQLATQIFLATPPAWRIFRLVTRTRFDLFVDDTQNRLVFAGGQTGLRGYAIGAFAGDARYLLNLELRSMPLEAAFLRIGGVVFWDGGDAAEELDELDFRQNVGLGLRILMPQANTIPLRVDWAFPIDPTRSALPGRISIGFGQGF